MNGAAIYSKEVLERYDEAELQSLEAELAAEEEKGRPRSGRDLSSQPYGLRRDNKETNDTSSDALVRVKREAMNAASMGNSSSGQGIQGYSAYQSTALYPASLATGPGEESAKQIATLQVKLNQRLGPEYISTRQGPGGGRLSYLEGWKAIDLANEVFGFNGWSSTVIRMDIDFLDETEGKKYNVGVSAVVRITLRDGTFHEDLGYGHCENVKMKHQALEKARKEATTDALKRALRTFGRLLGNCLYDKKFVDTASRMKATPSTYDVGQLKRNSDLPNDAGLSHAPSAATSVPVALTRAQPQVPQPHQIPQGQQHQHPEPALQNRSSIPTDCDSPDEISVDQPFTNVQSSTKAIIVSSRGATEAEQKSEEARLREERKAMAAAKQAALRLRKEGEEKARREAAAGPVITSLSKSSLAAERASRASQKIGTGKSLAPEFSEEGNFDEETEFLGVIDEYDLALAEAPFDEDSLEIETSKRSTIRTPRPVQKSNRMMDDSGIALEDDLKISHIRSHQGSHNATRGRFMPPTSSPSQPFRSDSGKQSFTPTTKHSTPSNSAKIPIRGGRRMSMVGKSSSPVGEESDFYLQGQPLPQRSQCSKQQVVQSSTNYHRTTMAPSAGKRLAANHSNNGDFAIKKLRPSSQRRN